MAGYLERGSIAAAYDVACLGVTEADWRALGAAALQVCTSFAHSMAESLATRWHCHRKAQQPSCSVHHMYRGTQSMDLDVAHAAYVRLRCMRNVDMVSRIAAGLAAGTPRRLLLAEVAACQGRFEDAAGLFVAEGQSDKVQRSCCTMHACNKAFVHCAPCLLACS
jgi:intraflagellar transport protein 122